MDILIVGADGFVGSNLKEYFESKGYHVTGTSFFSEPSGNEIKLDLTNDGDFKNLPKKNFDAVINAAGIVDQKKPRKLMLEVNSMGTKRLLKWVANSSRHFIQLSSITAYGLKVMGENRSESTARYTGKYLFPYAESKAKAEIFVEQSGLDYTILRLPAVFGSNDSYISKAIIKRIMNGSFRYFGKKDRLFSTMYVKNLGPIMKKLIEKGPQNDAFNCNDGTVSWRKFTAEYIKHVRASFSPKEAPIIKVIAHLRDKEYLLTVAFSYFGAHYPNDKLKRKIDFEVKFPWQKGVEEAVESFKVS